MQTRQTLEGVLHVFDETGREGGDWAFQDKRFIGPSSVSQPNGSWSMEGLHILEDGDFLSVYDKNDTKKILWRGWIRLEDRPTSPTAARTGGWIRTEQMGIARVVWEVYFLEGYPATLEPAP